MSSTIRTFTENEQRSRDAWVASRVENDCEGCTITYYADGEGWTPAQDCPVHGEDCDDYWRDLNDELDARWPGAVLKGAKP